MPMILHEPPAEPEATSADVYDVLACFTPSDMVGVGKRRIGGKGDDDADGGYVLADMLRPAQPILSLGVGWTVSFDHELAEQGHPIVLFDHTIDGPPQPHANFTWHKLGVATGDGAQGDLRPLATLADMLPDTGDAPILKIDVEGAEWEVFADASQELLCRFAQITVEFHWLLQLDRPALNQTAKRALRNLLVNFVPIHVHGNNFGPLNSVAGLAMVDTLEVSYVRRDLVQTTASQTWYPTEFDRSNNPSVADYRLWFFPFSPTTTVAPRPEV